MMDGRWVCSIDCWDEAVLRRLAEQRDRLLEIIGEPCNCLDPGLKSCRRCQVVAAIGREMRDERPEYKVNTSEPLYGPDPKTVRIRELEAEVSRTVEYNPSDEWIRHFQRIRELEAEVERMKREVTTARQFIDDAETSEKRLEAEVERLRGEIGSMNQPCAMCGRTADDMLGADHCLACRFESQRDRLLEMLKIMRDIAACGFRAAHRGNADDLLNEFAASGLPDGSGKRCDDLIAAVEKEISGE
jgi:hypothetical protein